MPVQDAPAPASGARRPLLSSLKSRLIASHSIVLLLALFLVLAISAAYLRRYERVDERQRLEQLAVPLTAEVNVAVLGRSANVPKSRLRVDALDAQASAMKIRLLVIDPDGVVRYDTDETNDLRGTTLPSLTSAVTRLLTTSHAQDRVVSAMIEPERTKAPLAGKRLLLAAGPTGNFESKRVLAIVVSQPRYVLLRFLLSRLLVVTVLSLGVASVAGYLFSRRIARPVERLTAAADAMAGGRLEQQVEATSDDELGQLVRSFNTMSRQVASTAQSHRDLLANVAHELRTPLTSVQGFAQALREGVIDDEPGRIRALETITRESERMGALIGQLLDLARLESGQSRLAMRAVAAGPLLRRVADQFEPAAAAKRVAISTTSDADLRILGDEGRLVQVLSNLLANAIRHTGEGGAITVAATPGADEDRVQIVVRDTGEGIATDRLATIFERFARTPGSGDDSAGFGLGLAIVRELVQLHGGTIGVHSHLGIGTTFVLSLPAADGGMGVE